MVKLLHIEHDACWRVDTDITPPQRKSLSSLASRQPREGGIADAGTVQGGLVSALKGGLTHMATFRAFVLGLAVIALVAGPAIAKGGGGGGGGGAGGGGGGAGGGGNGAGPAASGGGHGNGNGNGNGNGAGSGQGNGHGVGEGAGGASGFTTGAGRGTALTAPGSQHRSPTATQRLSTPTPGKASPTSGVKPGMGRVGTVPTTPGQTP